MGGNPPVKTDTGSIPVGLKAFFTVFSRAKQHFSQNIPAALTGNFLYDTIVSGMTTPKKSLLRKR